MPRSGRRIWRRWEGMEAIARGIRASRGRPVRDRVRAISIWGAMDRADIRRVVKITHQFTSIPSRGGRLRERKQFRGKKKACDEITKLCIAQALLFGLGFLDMAFGDVMIRSIRLHLVGFMIHISTYFSLPVKCLRYAKSLCCLSDCKSAMAISISHNKAC